MSLRKKMVEIALASGLLVAPSVAEEAPQRPSLVPYPGAVVEPEVPEHWQALADCESGNWLPDGTHEHRSARWDWAKPGTSIPPWGTRIHHGGLQFLPSTWDWKAPEGFPAYAYDATPAQQVEVAELVLAAQGWNAWPVCSVRVGLQ